jgi:hypothetical protein
MQQSRPGQFAPVHGMNRTIDFIKQWRLNHDSVGTRKVSATFYKTVVAAMITHYKIQHSCKILYQASVLCRICDQQQYNLKQRLLVGGFNLERWLKLISHTLPWNTRKQLNQHKNDCKDQTVKKTRIKPTRTSFRWHRSIVACLCDSPKSPGLCVCTVEAELEHEHEYENTPRFAIGHTSHSQQSPPHDTCQAVTALRRLLGAQKPVLEGHQEGQTQSLEQAPLRWYKPFDSTVHPRE